MFSQKLKQLRAEKKLTQEEFAKAIKVSKGAVAMWETGKRTPDTEMLMTISQFFRTTVDELIGNSRDIPEPSNISDKLSEREESLITNYRQLNTEGKDKTDEYVEDLIRTGKYSDDDDDGEVIAIAARKGGTDKTLKLKKRGNKSIFDAPDYR